MMEDVMTLGKLLTHSPRWLGVVVAVCGLASAATPRVTTIAGGYIGDGKPAISASLAWPDGVVRDSHGNIFLSDSVNCRIRAVSPAGVISTVAGTGICGYNGDGGPAKSAELSNLSGVAFDRHGNLLITDGARIRQITPGGIISTVAGNGTFGYSGDGGPATQASLYYPKGVFGDFAGNIYIADSSNYVIRKVDAKGIIHTVAGNHTAGFSGDGGPATQASLSYPHTVVADGKGNFYIADSNNYRVRIVNSAGIIKTYAGSGSFGNTGSGGPATSAAIGAPSGLLIGGGKLYLSTYSNIWAVTLSTQIINIVAGNPNATTGYNGDGNLATATSFVSPSGMAAGSSGSLLVADSGNNRVRQIAGSTQIVTTIAGGNIGDGGKATAASLNFLNYVAHIAFDSAGDLYIADIDDCRIRKVSPAGTISTFAGTGICGYSGDGGPATSATLFSPQAVAADSSGNVYIADTANSVIRKVDAAGTITTFLTTLTGSNGFSVPASANALATDGSGNLYASDTIYAIWRITPSGSTTIVAGELYDLGYNGDGIPATQAWLFLPNGVAVDSAGNVYISDWLNDRIRKVDTSGIISTVAGTGTSGFGGDGGPATSALISLPEDVAVDNKGNFYIADWTNLRVRVVNPSGTIETLAGSGSSGYNGNNLPAKQTNVFPFGLAVGSNGAVYVADQGSYRVRKID
jgi:sugar lactone lactonase YvrE